MDQSSVRRKRKSADGRVIEEVKKCRWASHEYVAEEEVSSKVSSISLKLLIDTHGKKVLFAEAGKDCVDFLFHILSLPVATIISLLREQGMVGSLANLYQSVENLNEFYIQPKQTKNNLLRPVSATSTDPSVPLLPLNATTCTAPNAKMFYMCSSYACTRYVSDDQRAVCPSCGCNMSKNIEYVAPRVASQQESEGAEGGFVKGVVTYMVTDDLVVQPTSAISGITLLNKFHVEKPDLLEEKVVQLGMNEAQKLLRASLHSKNVLTDVFLKDV